MSKQNLRTMARTLAARAHDNMLRLGNVLVAINANGEHYGWGYTTWKDYVEKEIGLHAGATYELMQISRWLQHERFTKERREAIVRLGRCKASALARMECDASKIDYWLKEAPKLTVAEMREAVFSVPENAPKAVGFWLHASQRKVVRRALKAAGDKHGFEYMGDQLEAICDDYLKRNAQKRRRHA